MDPPDLFLTSMVVSLFNQIIIFTCSRKVSSITIFIIMCGNEPQGPFSFTPVCDSVHTRVCLASSRQTYPLDRHPLGQTPLGTHPRQTPPRRRPLQRTVHILLECILVFHANNSLAHPCLRFSSLSDKSWIHHCGLQFAKHVKTTLTRRRLRGR